ncbi:MAG: hypothetical protein MIL41_16850 [Hyphomicrobiales bacterium]|jgi:hypothetical protein
MITHQGLTYTIAERACMAMDQVAFMHPPRSAGTVFVGSKAPSGKGVVGRCAFPRKIPQMRELSDGQRIGEYVGLHRHRGSKRRSSELHSCGNFVADFDYNAIVEGVALPHAGIEPEMAMAMLVAAMDAAGVPRPSYWIDSGRNVQAVWVSNGAKAEGWARQRAIYSALYGPKLTDAGEVIRPSHREASSTDLAFEARMLPMWRTFLDFGLDHACKDAARVIRMVGSINRKTGRMATLLWPTTFDEARTYSFDDLALCILPYTRAEIRALTEARRAAKAEAAALKQANGEPAKTYTPRGYWPAVLADLWRYQAAGLVKDGVRELWMFHTANAIAHVRGGTAQSWAGELAHIAGIPYDEAVSALGTLDGMQRRREAGGVDRFGRVPLYNCSAGKIAGDLKLSRETAIAHHMVAIVPGLSPKEGARIRQQRRRAALFPERVARDDHASEMLAVAHIALGLRADGWSLAEIGTAFGCSAGTARTWMHRAAEELGLASIEVDALAAYGRVQASETVVAPAAVEVSADATEDQVRGDRQGWSRSIGGAKPRQAPPSSQVVATADPVSPVAAGSVEVKRWTKQLAEVVTSSGVWEWFHYRDMTLGAATWETTWRRISASEPLPSDLLLAEAARAALDASTASAKRALRPGRVASDRRPVASQRGRRMGVRNLPPLDVDQAASAYRLASQGC